MITFKNIAGNKFLAVGTIQRKSALNGEKSLTGNLYDGKDVLNKIDKGWSLEFDGEPYVVTYFERNDNDNSVSFDAIHKFFWDMTKKVLYSSTEISGSHTIKWYLDQIFANTGYTYALNFSPAAIEKDNWGNKTRLSLFNDLITSIAGEFEINGTLISIFQNIGTDLSTIVRYGFNLSDMTIENDATSFVTYGEGFGAYANQENQTGDRVHVTYTSPLAGVYGILQAEPIDDQRYTSQANLQAAVKSQVDASFSVSVQLSLYDLTAAGYPYKMANVGDWLTAVDENLDFKQRIRIISIDDEFSADGTRISYTVTAGDIGLTKKYQDANASMASQVANAIVSAGQASTDANFALIAANGKLTAYYVGNYDELPTTANEGDLGWVTSGDGRLLYIYTKKADGSYYWEKRIDPEMGDQIAASVTDAVTQAKTHTDEVKQGLSSDIATAKSQAASQASTAEANAKSAASSQFTQAQSALSAAKSDLTNSIASEASERNQAVATVNSQAQTYANQAKEDALNTIAREVADRQSAITVLDTKATNAVNQAKSDINDTINAISVGGRNYILNSKRTLTSQVNANDTGWVDTSIPISMFSNMVFTMSVQVDYENVTAVTGGNRAGIELVAIEVKPDGSNVTRYFGAWQKANVGESFHGRIFATFDMRGLTLKSVYTPNHWGQGMYISGITATNVSVSNPKIEIGNKATDHTLAPEDVVLDYTTKDEQIKATITQYQTTNDGKVTKAQTDATTALGLVATKVSQTDYDQKTGDLSTKYTQVKQTADSQATDIANIKETATSQASKINSISSDVDGTKQSISDMETTQDSQSDKINQITTDVNGTKQSITDIQTKDGNQDTRMGTIETSVSGIKSDFISYKTTNDGAVQTAQTTAQTAVDGLKNKVSQTDYNTKTGQLQTDLTSTTQTANQAKTDIASIKQTDTSQDARMTQIESDASGVKTTVSNLQTAQGKQSGDISTLQQRADGFDATVTKVNNLSTGDRNYILDTANPKTQTSNGKDSQDLYNSAIFYSPIKNWGIANGDYIISFDWNLKTALSSDMQASVFFNQSPWQAQNFTVKSGQLTGHVELKFKLWSSILTATNDVTSLTFRIMSQMNLGNTITYSNLFMKSGTISTTWTPAPEDLSGATAKAQLTADNAALTISNYKQDADGRISKAQADIVTNANAITQKVSQADYNAKTGDLSTKVSTAQQTADGAVTTVGELKTTVNNLGQVNQLFNTEFSPDFSGWYSRGNSISVGTKSTLGTPFNGSNTFAKVDATTTRLQSTPIAVVPGTKISYSVQKLASSKIWSYINNVDVDGNVVNVPGTSSPEFGAIESLGYTKVENITIPSGVVYISFGLYLGGVSNGNVFSQPMLVFSDHVGTYVQGNYNNNAALAQVKITADSISNFVRDSSGNISSTFQNALSKTSIITGSTLATSIQQQTATQITSALTDNNGKIISLINQDSSGVQIAGKNIVLDGNTTVTGDFYAKGGNFKNLNASNLTVGTLNGSQVNITNINANNIVSGAISGANLNINLNTGSVVFQKGRINSSDYTTDINIDQGYISTANGVTRALLTQGKLQLIDPTFFSPQTNPYLEISNNSNVFNGMSALIKARDSLTVSINGYDNRGYDIPTYTETFVGLSIGKDGSGLMPTKIGGADRGVIISGGEQYSDSTVNLSKFPYIYVGSDGRGISPNGNRIYINASYVHSPSTYFRTTSGSANVVVNADGALVRSSSARKYKLDIKNNISIDDSLKLIDVPLSTWVDKHEHEENGSNERYFGMIAEDLRDAGLEYLVQYGEDNEVEGINYDRVALLLMPLVKELKERIEELESKGK